MASTHPSQLHLSWPIRENSYYFTLWCWLQPVQCQPQLCIRTAVSRTTQVTYAFEWFVERLSLSSISPLNLCPWLLVFIVPPLSGWIVDVRVNDQVDAFKPARFRQVAVSPSVCVSTFKLLVKSIVVMGACVCGAFLLFSMRLQLGNTNTFRMICCDKATIFTIQSQRNFLSI